MAVAFIFVNRARRLTQAGRFRTAPLGRWSAELSPSGRSAGGVPGAEKSRLVTTRPTVPQTDTGRQVEDTQVFERTIVKELGNLAP
jgi:hypothetical protein